MRKLLIFICLALISKFHAQPLGLISYDHVSQDSLFFIDISNGAINGLSDNTGDDWVGLGYDISNSIVWGSRDFVTKLDLNTNTSTNLYALSTLNQFFFGMDYDNNNNRLFAVGIEQWASNVPQTLYLIDQTTGVPTAVGSLGLLGSASYATAADDGISGLAYDTDLNTLWGFSASNKLYQINPTTGVATFTANLGSVGDVRGGAYDVSSSKLYCINSSADVYEINKTTGAIVNTIPGNNTFGFITGLAFVSPSCTPPSAPTIGTITQPTCAINSGSFIVTNPLGANLEYGINGVFQSSANFSGLAPGTYSITVRNTTNNCISSSISVTIIANPSSTLIPTQTHPLIPCGSTTTTVSVTSPLGNDIVYSLNGGVTQTSLGFSIGAGQHYIIATNTTTGCISDTLFFIVESAVTNNTIPQVSNTQISCLQSTGSITVTSPLSANNEYSIGGAYQSSNVFSGLIAGTYVVTFQDVNNQCPSWSVNVVINSYIPPNPIVISDDIIIEEGNSVNLTVSGSSDYIWTPSGTLNINTGSTVLATPTETTIYCVASEDQNGCLDTACVKVTILNCGEVFIPNAFSPNGNSNNESLKVMIANECVASFNFEIFNRWGEKVFRSSDVNEAWNGIYKDEIAASGVYFYKLKLKLFTESEEKTYGGNITLIK